MRYRDYEDLGQDFLDWVASYDNKQNKDSQKMEDYATDALQKVEHSLHQNASDFLRILSYGFDNELPEAKKIAEQLNLTPGHFFAIDENLKEFQKYLSEQEEENYDP